MPRTNAGTSKTLGVRPIRFVLSHPWRKNKGAPRMGHPALSVDEGYVEAAAATNRAAILVPMGAPIPLHASGPGAAL